MRINLPAWALPTTSGTFTYEYCPEADHDYIWDLAANLRITWRTHNHNRISLDTLQENYAIKARHTDFGLRILALSDGCYEPALTALLGNPKGKSWS